MSEIFPRIVQPRSASQIQLPGSLQIWSESGHGTSRGGVSRGWRWEEVYGPLKVDREDYKKWKAYVEWAWRSGETLILQHPDEKTALAYQSEPGDVTTPSTQSGVTIETTGWPASTTVLKPGDLVNFTNIFHGTSSPNPGTVFDFSDSTITSPHRVIGEGSNIGNNVVSDSSGNAIIRINPPVWPGHDIQSGDELANGDDIWFWCVIDKEPQFPEAGPHGWVDGIRISFRDILPGG